jgi:Predicted AAA-ATPase/PD-(D/E)XK nuclease superfamily
MKKLPIGEQSFRVIREQDLLYVDKTEQIYRLVTGSRYIFLSRPRRFGKSLTLSTMHELFSGHRELFKGLWVEDKWDWSVTNPVVHIAFNGLGYASLGLDVALDLEMERHAKHYGITLKATTYDGKLKELVHKLSEKYAPVVLLIDEYDKPLIDYLEKEELPKAKENRKILKSFYSGLKDKDIQEAMRFFMITGVSKFSQVSIFSDLNYLDDVTIGEHGASLVGYTQEELEGNFREWLEHLHKRFPELDKQQLLDLIKTWYNGYSWDAEHHVYNPFSILQLFNHRSFEDYWFKTGTPTFLIKLIKEARTFNLNDLKVSKSFFESFDFENMDVRSLLFQTGYLTIKHINRQRGLYTLDYPNREVEEAMHDKLLGALLHRMSADSLQPVLQLETAFLEKNLPRVVQIINSMLKDVPSLLLDAKDEHFYHVLVHLLFRYLGLFIESEVHTSDGRMDAVVQTVSDVFILEFKLNESAEAAMQQIKEKAYADKYRTSGKVITGVGINFGSGRKDVEGWTSEVL